MAYNSLIEILSHLYLELGLSLINNEIMYAIISKTFEISSQLNSLR